MTKARNIADLLDANGDVKTASLDNVPASNDASALTTGTLNNARLPSNISDGGTEGTKIATGTTAQRGSTAGQIRFNSTTGLAEYYTGTVFKSIDSPPTISSVNTSLIDSNSGGTTSIVITGTNFSSGATVTFIPSSGSNINANSVTVDSATQITAVVTDSNFVNANEPYSVKVENASNLSATLNNAINVDTTVAWQTASGSLGTISSTDTGNHFTVVATDADSDTITYSVVSGALPTGISLNSSTGIISGDPDDVSTDTTSNFTLRASTTDANADRAFSMIVTAPPASIEYLVVAGGGSSSAGNTGGGGAGGFRTATSSFNAGTVITATVGAGGSGGATSGSDSSISASGFTTYTSTGGGRGSGGGGGSGGSGGGSGYNTSTGGSGNTPATNPSQGNDGAGQNTGGFGYGSGGGGGAGSNGSSGTNTAGGNGGSGTSSSITGSAVTYAGGGGGSVEFGGSSSSGGSGGGGNGGNGSGGATSGQANTGGGGGSSFVDSGNGGSGVVILKVSTSRYSNTTTGSPTVTVSGSDTIIKFTGTGTYTA
jgi:hypothetical protein